MPRHPARAHATAGDRRQGRFTAIRLLALVLVVALPLATGCKTEPPPPPPPPPAPPPPPPPPPLTAPQVSARLEPLYLVLYERAFNPATLTSPDRYGAEFIDRLGAGGDAARGDQSLAKAVKEAIADTPPLATLVAKQCARAGLDPAVVVKWAGDAQQKLAPRQARDALLTMQVRQALADADEGNLHRAHVLLSDALSEMSGERSDDIGGTIAGFRQFFQEVPDGKRLETFAKQLEDYSVQQEEAILLAGEHAAILHAGGLSDAAEFTRSKLVTQFDLITLPLIDLAIARGESYGFKPPPQLQEIRRRIGGHADALRTSRAGPDDAFRTKAEGGTADPAYTKLLDGFVKQWGTKAGGAAAGSMEKQINELRKFKRPLSGWLKEKAICLEQSPFFLVDRDAVSPAFLETGCPVAFDEAAQAFGPADFTRAMANEKKTAPVVEWCQGKDPSKAMQDGSGHFLLGWYWLENRRPDLARAALVAGAEQLLAQVKEFDVDSLLANPEANRATLAVALADQLNAYRLLVAAALITSSPPGAQVDSRGSYLPQVDVLLLAWKQRWLKCGLPQQAADDMLIQFGTAVERSQRELREQGGLAGAATGNDRYFFFDYRFRDGTVPDVVVKKAMEDQLVEDPRLPELTTSDRILDFFRSFQKPREFSPGFSARWRGPAK